jgi:hypothetical protein
LEKGIVPREGRVAASFSRLSWSVILVLCFTVGLAPFNPPHIVEKIRMLFAGQPMRPVDWLDLALHGSPWLLLAGKGVFSLKKS